jgi:hypothetical protein
MNRLTAEPLVAIVAYFPLSNRFNCLLVCKKWYQAITSNKLLYEEIEFANEGNLQKALIVFERKKYFGEQVNQIALTRPDDY